MPKSFIVCSSLDGTDASQHRPCWMYQPIPTVFRMQLDPIKWNKCFLLQQTKSYSVKNKVRLWLHHMRADPWTWKFPWIVRTAETILPQFWQIVVLIATQKLILWSSFIFYVHVTMNAPPWLKNVSTAPKKRIFAEMRKKIIGESWD